MCVLKREYVSSRHFSYTEYCSVGSQGTGRAGRARNIGRPSLIPSKIKMRVDLTEFQGSDLVVLHKLHNQPRT
jgi:hypothetical protein